jgi:hypothetical protein
MITLAVTIITTLLVCILGAGGICMIIADADDTYETAVFAAKALFAIASLLFVMLALVLASSMSF